MQYFIHTTGQHERYTFQCLLISIFLVHLVTGPIPYAIFDLKSVLTEGIQRPWLGEHTAAPLSSPSTAASPPLPPPLPSFPSPWLPVVPPSCSRSSVEVPASPRRWLCLVWETALSQGVTRQKGSVGGATVLAGLKSRNVVSLSFRSKCSLKISHPLYIFQS